MGYQEALDANYRDGTLAEAVKIIAEGQDDSVVRSCLLEAASRLQPKDQSQ